ncbi:hypothetical protein QFZ35_004090 [Arthrobacter ulcerisalmonis]|nr:hypothetical protein [Arthrobacter ulcerisalmonis]
MDLLIGSHGLGGVGVLGIGGAALSALGEGQHKHGAEVPGKEPQEPASRGGPLRLARVVAQQGQPVGFVPAFGLGQGQEDVPFLALAVLGQVTVDGGFSTLVGQVLAPPFDVRRRGLALRGVGGLRGRGMRIGLGVLRHWYSWAGKGMFSRLCLASVLRIGAVFWLANLDGKFRSASKLRQLRPPFSVRPGPAAAIDPSTRPVL